MRVLDLMVTFSNFYFLKITGPEFLYSFATAQPQTKHEAENRAGFSSVMQRQTFMSLKQPFQKGDKYLKGSGLIHCPKHLTKRLKGKITDAG